MARRQKQRKINKFAFVKNTPNTTGNWGYRIPKALHPRELDYGY